MQQLLLFEKEDKLDNKIKFLVKHIYRTGRSHQYLDIYVRQREESMGEVATAILKALGDINSTAEVLCYTVGGISSLKHLKTPNPDFSKLFTTQLQVEPKEDISKQELISRIEMISERWKEFGFMIESMNDNAEITEEQHEEIIETVFDILIRLRLTAIKVKKSFMDKL